jgi:hypothetical protein
MADNDDDKGEKKGGGLFGAIKGALFEESPDAPESKPAPAPQRPAPTPAYAPPPQGYAAPQAYVPPGQAPADPEIRKVLEVDVQAAAKPAFSQFETMSASMAPVIPDEFTRFRAVLAALTPQGVTLDAIIFDVDECLQALDKKEQEASKAAEAARKKHVGALEQAVADKRQRIAALKAEMAQLEATAAHDEASIASESAHIESTQRSFTATVAQFRAELLAKKQQISRLGKGA